jgi:hypothetical protein
MVECPFSTGKWRRQIPCPQNVGRPTRFAAPGQAFNVMLQCCFGWLRQGVRDRLGGRRQGGVYAGQNGVAILFDLTILRSWKIGQFGPARIILIYMK